MIPASAGPPRVAYPERDGNPMADNTLQFRWIVTLQGNLDLLFRDTPDVFVAGDNLIYPVAGSNTVRVAPDVYVAFGRPKGDRGSYRVSEEGGIFPQVIFEVLSPGNRSGELARKFTFYERHGAEEYYILNPDRVTLEGYVRRGNELADIDEMDGWVSPRMGIRFAVGDDVAVFYPDGRPFLTFLQLGDLQQETARRADAERARADAAEKRADALAAKLRELGIKLNGE